MIRPLLVASIGQDIRAELMWLDGVVRRAESLEDALAVYRDDPAVPVFAVGPDVTWAYSGPRLAVPAVLLYTDPEVVDWAGVNRLGIHVAYHLPADLEWLVAYLEEAPTTVPSVRAPGCVTARRSR